jgi:ComF family protein
MIERIRNFFAFGAECLFPSGCGVCGRMLVDPREAWYGICGECRPGFRFEPNGRCDVCGKPLVSETGRCLDCRERKTMLAWDRIVSVYPYTGSRLKLLGSFKFGKSLAAGRFFAEKVREALAVLPLEEPAESWALVPVPPRPGKIRKTGWDQIEWLARILEHGGGPPVSRCLKRLRSETQKKLDRENRLRNLKGRVVVKTAVPETAVLLDDIITTGATIEACADALKAAGTKTVFGICLFYD